MSDESFSPEGAADFVASFTSKETASKIAEKASGAAELAEKIGGEAWREAVERFAYTLEEIIVYKSADPLSGVKDEVLKSWEDSAGSKEFKPASETHYAGEETLSPLLHQDVALARSSLAATKVAGSPQQQREALDRAMWLRSVVNHRISHEEWQSYVLEKHTQTIEDTNQTLAFAARAMVLQHKPEAVGIINFLAEDLEEAKANSLPQAATANPLEDPHHLIAKSCGEMSRLKDVALSLVEGDSFYVPELSGYLELKMAKSDRLLQKDGSRSLFEKRFGGTGREKTPPVEDITHELEMYMGQNSIKAAANRDKFSFIVQVPKGPGEDPEEVPVTMTYVKAARLYSVLQGNERAVERASANRDTILPAGVNARFPNMAGCVLKYAELKVQQQQIKEQAAKSQDFLVNEHGQPAREAAPIKDFSSPEALDVVNFCVEAVLKDVEIQIPDDDQAKALLNFIRSDFAKTRDALLLLREGDPQAITRRAAEIKFLTRFEAYGLAVLSNEGRDKLLLTNYLKTRGSEEQAKFDHNIKAMSFSEVVDDMNDFLVENRTNSRRATYTLEIEGYNQPREVDFDYGKVGEVVRGAEGETAGLKELWRRSWATPEYARDIIIPAAKRGEAVVAHKQSQSNIAEMSRWVNGRTS